MYLLVTLLCVVTLFVTSSHFVNQEITLKWLALVTGTGLAGLATAFGGRKLHIPQKSVFCIIVFYLMYVLVFDCVSGFNLQLLVYSLCLFLLYIVMLQTVARCRTEYLFGIVAVAAFALALHGILQYAGMAASRNAFTVTGAFDNPAGFASALCLSLPFVLYFVRHSNIVLKIVAIVTAIVLLTATALSGSRAAMLACLISVILYTYKYSATRFKRVFKYVGLGLLLFSLPALYLLKKDSADGRLLIWQNTLKVAATHPLTGQGYSSFQSQYMPQQAAYFEANPDSRYAQLADNVLHPFNEFLLAVVEHGIVGVLCIIALAALTLRAYRRNRSDAAFAALLGLSAFAVVASFSYPCDYPFTWLVLTLCLAVIVSQPANPTVSPTRKFGVLSVLTLIFSAVLLATNFVLFHAETQWNRIARLSLAGQTEEVLPMYDNLYTTLGKSGIFLYNHAAELHETARYEQSLAVFARCIPYLNDMDVQMLLADNYKQLERYTEAERHLKLAANMCPARFMPLYRLATLYAATGRTAEAVALAQTIINKRVKIPSTTVSTIKRKTEKMLDSLALITELRTVRYDITIQALKDNDVFSCLMPLKPFKTMQPGQADLSLLLPDGTFGSGKLTDFDSGKRRSSQQYLYSRLQAAGTTTTMGRLPP
jgi:O-antigen ligase